MNAYYNMQRIGRVCAICGLITVSVQAHRLRNAQLNPCSFSYSRHIHALVEQKSCAPHICLFAQKLQAYEQLKWNSPIQKVGLLQRVLILFVALFQVSEVANEMAKGRACKHCQG